MRSTRCHKPTWSSIPEWGVNRIGVHGCRIVPTGASRASAAGACRFLLFKCAELRRDRCERRDLRRGHRPVQRARAPTHGSPKEPKEATCREAYVLPEVRLHRRCAREGYPRRMVGVGRVARGRAEAPRRGRSPALACRYVPRRLRPASRLVPELASVGHGRVWPIALQERHVLRLHR